MSTRPFLRVSAVVPALSALVLLAACSGAQKVDDKPPAPDVPAITGKFTNDTCIPQPQADGTTSYLKMAFDLTPTTWAVAITTYGDEACATKLGTSHFDGPYTLTGPSAAVPGAFEGEFGFAHRTITPHVDGYVALMQSLSCGKAPYAVGQPQDVLAAGCPEMGIPPAAACPKEYDLVKLDGTSLTFGKRPADNDMCAPDKRPTELSPLSFTRAP